MKEKIHLGFNFVDNDFITEKIYIDTPLISNPNPTYLEYEYNYQKNGVEKTYKELKRINKSGETKIRKDTLDYSEKYVGSIDPRYKVIKTLSRNYDSPTIKQNRMLVSNTYPYCFDIERAIDEYDIYNYLSSKKNILIALRTGEGIFLYCVDRNNMSDRIVNNINFRAEIDGIKYVKILPKIWTDDEYIDELLNEDKSIFLFSYISKLSYYGDDDIPMSQDDELGIYVKFMNSYDLIDLEKS